MIDYEKVFPGDILRVVEPVISNFAKVGDLVRVIQVRYYGVSVENDTGNSRKFVFNCGAARFEPTEWKDDLSLAATEGEENHE